MAQMTLELRARRPWWFAIAAWASVAPYVARYVATGREPTEDEYAANARRLARWVRLNVIDVAPPEQ